MSIPVLDSYASGIATGATSNTVTLTTTTANTVVVVVAYAEDSTPPQVTGVSGGGLTFTRRSMSRASTVGDLEVWWAVAPSVLTAVPITISYAGTFDDANATVMAFSGCNTSAPWDTHASLPATQGGGSSNSYTPSHTVSTSADAGLALFVLGSANAATSMSEPPPAFYHLPGVPNNGGVRYANIGIGIAPFGAQRASLAYTWTSGSQVNTGGESVFDVLVSATPSGVGAPWIDTVVGSTATGSISHTVTLSTTASNALIVVAAYAEQTTPPSVTSVTGGGLTFTRRAMTRASTVGDMELWWAVASSPLSSVPISINYAAAFDDAAATVFSVGGINTTAPWDTHASLPSAFSGGASTSFMPSHTVSVDRVGGITLFAVGSAGAAGINSTNLPSGFTGMGVQRTAAGSRYGNMLAGWRMPPGAVTNQTYTWTAAIDDSSAGIESVFDVVSGPTAAPVSVAATTSQAQGAMAMAGFGGGGSSASALLSLDTAFEGLPFADTGPLADVTLDLAFEGLPFTPAGGAATPASVSASVATSQGQTGSASASTAVAAAVATSQAQASSASTGTGVAAAVATTQAQTSSAAASVSAASSASTSQAQQLAAIVQVGNGAAIATRQAQTATLAASVAVAVNATTSQGQQASASASAGVSVTVTTSQGQSASASAAASSNSVTSIATSQAQQVGASVGVNVSVSVATSQAQQASVGAGAAVSVSAATSQGQKAAASLTVAASVASTTSQGQTASSAAAVRVAATASAAQAQSSAAVAAVTASWSVVSRIYNTDFSGPFGEPIGFSNTLPAFALTSGDHVMLCVEFDGDDVSATSVSATDTAGNTYTASLPVRYADNSTGMLWLYALNATGNAANEITVTFGASTQTYSIYYTTVVLRSPGPASFDVLARNATNIASTTIQAGPFNTSGSGFILAAITSVRSDTESLWTGGMQFIAPRSTYFRGVGYLATPSAQTGKTVGVSGSTVSTTRLLSAVALRDGAATPVAAGTTRQGQTSSATVTLGSLTATATRQGQTTGASAAVGANAQAGSAQAQQASAQATAYHVLVSQSAQGQSASVLVGVAVDGTTATASGQHSAGALGVAVNASVQAVQAQTAAAQGRTGADATITSASAQQASGTVASVYVLAVASAQAQVGNALAGIDSRMQGAGAQAQATSGEAGVAVDTSATTDQRQRVSVQVRGESINTLESAQRQHVAGTLGLSSDAPAATRQAQSAAALAGVAVDMQVVLGQAQHIGDGNLLVVSVDAVVVTAQAQQHVAGELVQYEAMPGALDASRRIRPALAGSARAHEALTASIRVRPAAGGRVDLRPDR